MSKKEKPLPEPPSTPFGRKRAFEENENREPLMADEMAMAMSEGKLNEFLKKNMPDSEYAGKLAEMMMGMTGMMPPEGFSGKPASETKDIPEKHGTQIPAPAPPDDVVKAVRAGDVKSLMELLAREHKNRTAAPDSSSPKGKKLKSPLQPAIEKTVIDQLIKIAADNNTSVDWLLFRAIKRYVQEYQKTGKL